MQLTRPPPEQDIVVVPPDTVTVMLPEVQEHVIGNAIDEAVNSSVTNNAKVYFILNPLSYFYALKACKMLKKIKLMSIKRCVYLRF